MPLLEAIASAASLLISNFNARDISHTAWSFATLAVQDTPLLASLSSAAIRLISAFTLQGLSNSAWAFATLGCGHGPLLDSIASASIRRICADGAGDSPGAVASIIGLVQAFPEESPVGSELFDAAAAALQRRGEARDGEFMNPGEPSTMDGVTAAANKLPAPAEPHVFRDLQQLCFLWKPAGWTVTVTNKGNRGADSSAVEAPGPGTSAELQQWLASILGPRHPIALDAGVSHGLLHRLDRNTSGAMLWAKGYQGYYGALLQFSASRVRKVYVCLCQGHLPRPGRLLEAPLLEPPAGRAFARTAVAPEGKPARTSIASVAHVLCPRGGRFSLVEILLHTGRRHQIRAHLCHEGHRLAGDVAYGSEWLTWCQRVFLHACGLGLVCKEGPIRVDVPLPADLRDALRQLSPLDRRSRACLDRWLGS